MSSPSAGAKLFLNMPKSMMGRWKHSWRILLLPGQRIWTIGIGAAFVAFGAGTYAVSPACTDEETKAKSMFLNREGIMAKRKEEWGSYYKH